MNMNKLIVGLGLLLGLTVLAGKASAADTFTSTWTAQFHHYVTTMTDSPNVVETLGGLTPGGNIDITTVRLSTGYNNGAYFICVDSFPHVAATGGAYAIGNFLNEQYMFPPVPFVASTSTVNTGLIGFQQAVDFRNYDGSGKSVTHGLTCFIVGDTSNKY